MLSGNYKREKVHAIILSRRDVGEADRLVTVFTRSHGLLQVMAKGVRRIPSRRGGYLEPLSHVLMVITGSHGRYYLMAVEEVDDYLKLHDSPNSLERVQAVAHTIFNLLEEEEEQMKLFDAFHQMCQAMPSLIDKKQDLLEVALELYVLRCAGVMPQLQKCQICQKNNPDESVVLNGQEGGWVCLSCHGSLEGTANSLSSRPLKALKWLAQNPHQALKLKTTKEESEQLRGAMHHYLLGAVGRPVTVSQLKKVVSYG